MRFTLTSFLAFAALFSEILSAPTGAKTPSPFRSEYYPSYYDQFPVPVAKGRSPLDIHTPKEINTFLDAMQKHYVADYHDHLRTYNAVGEHVRQESELASYPDEFNTTGESRRHEGMMYMHMAKQEAITKKTQIASGDHRALVQAFTKGKKKIERKPQLH